MPNATDQIEVSDILCSVLLSPLWVFLQELDAYFYFLELSE